MNSSETDATVQEQIRKAIAAARADEREKTEHEILHKGVWHLSCSRCATEMQEADMAWEGQ